MIARLALLLAGTLWLCGCGQPASDPQRDWPPPSPALWQVTTPDGSGEGWLFGTVHALPEDLSWRTQALDEAFARSGVLVVEIADLGDGSAAGAAFADYAHDPALPPLVERLPAADRTRIKGALAQAGLGIAAFAGTESWAAALLLASELRAHDPLLGVDRALIGDAEEVVGLESFAGQYQRFDRLSPGAQLSLLRSVAEEAGEARSDERLEAWLVGDLDRLEELSQGALLDNPELYKTLLVERNRAWAGSIADLVRQGRRPFVAVGAGHMIGPEGLPALLAKDGFTVSRLR